MTEAFALAAAAADALSARTGVERHDIAVVLGSGWGRTADVITGDDASAVTVPLTDLPGFPPPSAIGHGGVVRSASVNNRRVLLFLGRVHLYEGHPASVVAHGVRTAAAAGCRIAVLTNGAGSLRTDWSIGQPVLISDHVNLTGHSPLTGPNPPASFGSRFVDLTDLYSRRLRQLAREVDPSLPEGVYVGYPGPHFETPAEIRMAGTIGGDLVGMSTVLEAIAARHVGMEVLGLSLATNLAAGISAVPIDAEHVLAVGDGAAARVGALARDVLERILAS
ncbi:MAG: purine-nucleoside phosphorylase [Acidimicrobiia bacterium]|nr:purine-nucleoside phosphorylase [Acidimicrobiia bacterium]